MKVSQKSDYALRALLDLAEQAREEGAVRLAEIARRTRAPEKFLEAILVELRKAELVRSRRGPEGGHRLARPAGQITVGEIRRAVDGPLSLAETQIRPGQDPVGATLRAFWGEVESAIDGVLEKTTLEDLQRRIRAHGQVPDYTI